MLETVLFGTFGGLLLSSAIMVVFASETIQGALWLVLSFSSAASLWILLSTEFLGLILILVYVGAILTLFLFVIMTLSTTPTQTLSTGQSIRLYGTALSVPLAGLGCILYSLHQHLNYSSITQPALNTIHQSVNTLPKLANTQALGIRLYTQYVYPFELASILLLSAIIVSISLHSQSQFKYNGSPVKSILKQDQLKVRRVDRIKLVSGD